MSRLGDLTIGMIGTCTSPELKAKGVETKYLVLYCVQLLEDFTSNCPEPLKLQKLLRLGKLYIRYMELLRGPRRVSESNYEDTFRFSLVSGPGAGGGPLFVQ